MKDHQPNAAGNDLLHGKFVDRARREAINPFPSPARAYRQSMTMLTSSSSRFHSYFVLVRLVDTNVSASAQLLNLNNLEHVVFCVPMCACNHFQGSFRWMPRNYIWLNHRIMWGPCLHKSYQVQSAAFQAAPRSSPVDMVVCSRVSNRGRARATSLQHSSSIIQLSRMEHFWNFHSCSTSYIYSKRVDEGNFAEQSYRIRMKVTPD
jgi:hypothetical protein